MTQLHEGGNRAQDVGEQDLHNRQGAPVGSWHTVFLNNRLAELLPNLHDKLFAAGRADAETGACSIRSGTSSHCASPNIMQSPNPAVFRCTSITILARCSLST